jgi:hypothetical protein
VSSLPRPAPPARPRAPAETLTRRTNGLSLPADLIAIQSAQVRPGRARVGAAPILLCGRNFWAPGVANCWPSLGDEFECGRPACPPDGGRIRSSPAAGGQAAAGWTHNEPTVRRHGRTINPLVLMSRPGAPAFSATGRPCLSDRCMTKSDRRARVSGGRRSASATCRPGNRSTRQGAHWPPARRKRGHGIALERSGSAA